MRVLVDPQDMQEYLPSVLGPMRQRCPKGVLNALAVRTLLEGRVPVRLYPVGKEFALLHMKMAIFDRKSAIVGSTNWVRGGLEWVGETDVELHGGRVIDELLTEFALDWDRSVGAPLPPPSVQRLCRIYEQIVQYSGDHRYPVTSHGSPRGRGPRPMGEP